MVARNVVVLISDARFFPAAAFVATRLAKLNPRNDTEIFVMSDSDKDIRAAKAHGVSAQLKQVDFADFPAVSMHLPSAALFRLALPEVFGPEVEKILYLDGDVSVATASLFRLFDLDMHGHAVAAARDLLMCFGRTPVTEKKRASAGPAGKYLNSGVLLLDRSAYLKARLTKAIMERAIGEATNDQDAMNMVLQGNWLELSPAANLIVGAWNSFVRRVASPMVVHFMGRTKPWHADFGDDHPVRDEMAAYFASSPWPDFFQKRTFAQAWGASQAAQGLFATSPAPKLTVLPPLTDVDGMWRYLQETKFADVEVGITNLNLGIARPVLPAALLPPKG